MPGSFTSIRLIQLIPSAAGNTYNVTATDGLKSGDSNGNIASLFNSLLDGFKLSEVLSIIKVADVSLIDSIKLGDSLSSLLVADVVLSDGLKLSEALSALLTMYPSIADGIKFSDIATQTSNIIELTAIDGMKIGDSNLIRLAALIALILSMNNRSITAKIADYDLIVQIPNRAATIKVK